MSNRKCEGKKRSANHNFGLIGNSFFFLLLLLLFCCCLNICCCVAWVTHSRSDDSPSWRQTGCCWCWLSEASPASWCLPSGSTAMPSPGSHKHYHAGEFRLTAPSFYSFFSYSFRFWSLLVFIASVWLGILLPRCQLLRGISFGFSTSVFPTHKHNKTVHHYHRKHKYSTQASWHWLTHGGIQRTRSFN